MMGKILIIYSKGVQEILNRQSALGSYILTFAKLLSGAGNTVHINEFELANLLEFPASQSAPKIKYPTLKKFIPRCIKHLIRDCNFFSKNKILINNIKENKYYPNFIIEFYSYGSNIGYELKKHFQCKLITVFDSPVLEEFEYFNGRKLFFKREVLKLQFSTLENSSLVIVYTNAVKDYLIRHGIKNEKINIHQNIDFSRFDFLVPKENGQFFNIVFIGSFLKWHKVERLVDAYKKLLDEGLPVKLFLIGAGMEYEGVSLYVKNLGISEKVEMPGFCDGDKLLSYKKMAHIGVMPGSNWYGAPNKVFEYAAAGLLVLAPSTPSISALFPTDAGLLLFKESDDTDLYKQLKWAVENWSKAKLFAVNFQNYVKSNFSVEKTLQFYSEIFKN